MEHLTQNAEYDTPSGRGLCLLKRLHLPIWISFYTRVAQAIFRGSKVARKGGYTRAFWSEQSRWVFEVIESHGGVFHIRNLDNIRKVDGPVVFVSNHMSALETLILPCLILPIKDFTFVVKDVLLDYPVFGHLLRSTEPIAVTRKNPREDLKTVLEKGE
ncbi:MAG: lysophospholipid acyltransferase family protein, partial [bacterium]